MPSLSRAPLSPAAASLMASGSDSINLPLDMGWVIYCTLHHDDRGQHSLNVFRSEGVPQTIPGVHPQYHGLIGVAALVVLARELNIPLNDPANPSQSFLNDLSTTLLAPQWAPSAYMLQTGMQARGEDRQMVHRLVMSAPCRTAVFLGHVLPHGAVQYGPYKLAGSEVVLSLPWRRQLGFRFSEAVQRSCTFIADCRVSYLQKQIGPSPSIGHGPRPRRRFSAAAARAVIDARRSHHNPCLLLHQNDHLEPLSYLRAGEHGYVFLTNPTLSSRQPFIPSDEVIPFQDLIPPRRWIHLFVQSADRYVEYLGVYERVQPSRVWMWHRSTPDEWEHLSQQAQTSVVDRVSYPGESRETVVGQFRSGERSLSAVFIRNVDFDDSLIADMEAYYPP